MPDREAISLTDACARWGISYGRGLRRVLTKEVQGGRRGRAWVVYLDAHPELREADAASESAPQAA